MQHLLYIEWLKIKKYRTFWILSGLFLGLMLVWNVAISNGSLKLGGNINILDSSYTFPSVWDNLAYWTKFFSGLIAILIITLTTNEYQFRTNRQNVIEGLQRQQVFHAKWYLLTVMAIAVTLFMVLEGFAFNLLYGGDISKCIRDTKMILYVQLLTLNYFGFAYTLSLFIRKSGTTVMLFLLYNYIIEIIASQFINGQIGGHLGSLLPMQCSADLIPFPALKMVRNMIAGNGLSDTVLVLTSMGWIVVYYVLGKARVMRTDW